MPFNQNQNQNQNQDQDDDKTRRKQRLRNKRRDADRQPDERLGDGNRKTPRKRIDPKNWEDCYEDDWDNEE